MYKANHSNNNYEKKNAPPPPKKKKKSIYKHLHVSFFTNNENKNSQYIGTQV